MVAVHEENNGNDPNLDNNFEYPSFRFPENLHLKGGLGVGVEGLGGDLRVIAKD